MSQLWLVEQIEFQFQIFFDSNSRSLQVLLAVSLYLTLESEIDLLSY